MIPMQKERVFLKSPKYDLENMEILGDYSRELENKTKDGSLSFHPYYVRTRCQ